MAGTAVPGITPVHTFGPSFGAPELKADPYDPILARAELAAAGFETGVNPITPEPVSEEIADYIIFGSSIPFEGKVINPITGEPAPNVLGYVQESEDEQTWRDLGAVVTDKKGEFKVLVVPSTLGDSYLRTQFTGYTAPLQSFNPVGLVTGLDKLYYDEAVEEGALPFVLAPQTSESIKITTKPLSEILSTELEDVASKDDLATLSTEISSLKTDIADIADVKDAVSTQTTIIYASIGIAVVAIIIAIVAITRKS